MAKNGFKKDEIHRKLQRTAKDKFSKIKPIHELPQKSIFHGKEEALSFLMAVKDMPTETIKKNIEILAKLLVGYFTFSETNLVYGFSSKIKRVAEEDEELKNWIIEKLNTVINSDLEIITTADKYLALTLLLEIKGKD